MGFDEEYLEGLLNEIDAIVDPESLTSGDGYGIGMPEEEEGFVSAVAEDPEEVEEAEVVEEVEVVSESEARPQAEEENEYPDNSFELDSEVAAKIKALTSGDNSEQTVSAPDMSAFDTDTSDPNKVLSREEIEAMFAAASDANPLDVAQTESDNEIIDNLNMAASSEDTEADGMMNLSVDEIDAILDAAKSSENDISELPSDDDDLMELLSRAGESDLSDIQNILQSDENGQALDTEAFMNAMAMPDVADDILDVSEVKEKRKKKSKKKKKQSEEASELDELTDIKEKKKSFLSKLIELLTEPVEEEAEIEEVSMNDIGIASDENREILEELDREDRKKKKKKKSKKGKKAKADASEPGEDSIDDIKEKSPDEVELEKKKKKKKKEKVKKVKEKAPEEPSKRLPRKRVRVTFILCISILIALLLFMFLLTRVVNLSDARWAFDNQDYETTYENLYGLDLGDDDDEIYKKSKLILMVDRKYKSYQNYMNLGMKLEAASALFEAVSEYPDIREAAVSYGIEAQTDYTYSLILAALSEFGISEAEAKEIVSYDSKVRYTLRIQSIANGTPYTYDDEMAAHSYNPETNEDAATFEQTVKTVDDILPEEMDILPENPDSIYMDNGQNPPTNMEESNTVSSEPQVIDAEVEVNW